MPQECFTCSLFGVLRSRFRLLEPLICARRPTHDVRHFEDFASFLITPCTPHACTRRSFAAISNAGSAVAKKATCFAIAFGPLDAYFAFRQRHDSAMLRKQPISAPAITVELFNGRTICCASPASFSPCPDSGLKSVSRATIQPFCFWLRKPFA